MGIDVTEKKEVRLNESHDRLLVTCPTKNPKSSHVGDLEVNSIYKRQRSKDREGDGNPFIYALKRKDGFSIQMRELYKFRPSFYKILKKIGESTEANFVVPMPSSHPIALFLATRLCRIIDASLAEDFFVKQKVQPALESIDVSKIPNTHRKDVKKQLAKLRKLPKNSELSLKNFPPKIRKYFQPIVLNDAYNGPALEGKIVLVDDLLSTGTTLDSAAKIAAKNGLVCRSAVCLLSDL